MTQADFTPAACRAARGLLGLSQADLAKAAGVSRPMVVDFERETKPPSARTRERLRVGLEERGVVFTPGGAVLADQARPQLSDALLARVLRTLQRHATDLRTQGVRHLSIFGSLARGKADRDSDIDVLVDLDPNKSLDIVDFAGLVRQLEQLVGRPVDLARRDQLKPHVAPSALADEIRVF